MTISRTATEIRIDVGGVTIDMSGHFSDGAFMIDPRGSGESGHTTVAFVNFLPTLDEGARVDTAAVNGVADEAFLFGDGKVGFAVELRSAMSAYRNALGVYEVDADGNIFDAHIVFANTLNVSEGARTVNLGTPGDGVEIGFFLIQDGFGRFANLSDNLSFVTPDGQPANVDGSLPVLLQERHARRPERRHDLPFLRRAQSRRGRTGPVRRGAGRPRTADRLRGSAERQRR